LNAVKRDKRRALNHSFCFLGKQRQKKEHCNTKIKQAVYQIAKMIFFSFVIFLGYRQHLAGESNSSSVSEKNLAMDFSDSMLGYPLSDSHFEIAVLETNRFSASSSCVRWASVRSFFNFSPKVISHHHPDFIFLLYHSFRELSRYFSSRQLFYKSQARGFRRFPRRYSQEKVHIGGDTEATFTAQFTFQLTAEVACVIVEEFDLLSVGECVFRINKRTGKILLFYQGAKHFKIFLANYLDVIHSTLNEINIIPQIVHQHCEARFCY
jgi:hypothetical protein